MGSRNLGGNIKTKPQSLGISAAATSRERLEQPFYREWRDRGSSVGDRQFENAFGRGGENAYRSVGISMLNGVAEEVGKKLRDTGAVAVDRSVKLAIYLDCPFWPR